MIEVYSYSYIAHCTAPKPVFIVLAAGTRIRPTITRIWSPTNQHANISPPPPQLHTGPRADGFWPGSDRGDRQSLPSHPRVRSARDLCPFSRRRCQAGKPEHRKLGVWGVGGGVEEGRVQQGGARVLLFVNPNIIRCSSVEKQVLPVSFYNIPVENKQKSSFSQPTLLQAMPIQSSAEEVRQQKTWKQMLSVQSGM